MKRIQNAALARKWWGNPLRSEGEPIRNTPPAAATFNISFTAQNGVSPNATQNFTLTVVGQAPAITSANNTTFKVGVAGSITVTCDSPRFNVAREKGHVRNF